MPYFNFGPPGNGDQCTKSTVTTALLNGTTLFTIAGGPIEILELQSVCTTVQQAVATTLQYSSSPTVGSAATFSGASGSLSGVAAGATVSLAKATLATAPTIALAAAGGIPATTASFDRVIVQAGTITMVTTNDGTGAWSHYMRWRPLGPAVTVV